MRVKWNQRSDRQWAGLMVVGVLILMGVVLLQGVVSAVHPGTEAQQVDPDGHDVALRVLTASQGSRIGVSIEEVEESEASGSLDEGAYVNDVREGTPAADAGFQAGDVIVEFDGERVRSAVQLSRLVRETPAGREVSATVMRDGSSRTLQVTPETGPGWMSSIERHLPNVGHLDRDWSAHLPNTDHLRFGRGMAIPAGPRGLYFSDDDSQGRMPRRLGIEVVSVSSQLADYFGVEEGVLVATVEPDSVASVAGLQAGDVITAINAKAVDGPSVLRRHVSTLEPGETFTIEITRDGREVRLDGQIDEERPRRLHRQRAI